MNATHHRTKSAKNSTSTETLVFLADDPRKSSGKATSRCGNYVITWSDLPKGRWRNAWFGSVPRKHLIATYSEEEALRVCTQHFRKYFQPVQKTYSSQPQQQVTP